MTDVTQERMTIDELARRVGMTVRNVRAYGSRGLLPPPELEGRTGIYGAEHVARLELVQDLQAQGFNLGAIKRLLETRPGASVSEVLDFTRAVAAPFTDEQPQAVDADAFLARWGDELTPRLAERAQALGLVRPLGDGRYEVRSPRLIQASGELAELGVPLEAALEVTETLKAEAQAIADAYIHLFLEQVWRPFHEAGEPAEEWPRVREALDRVRPLATESLMAAFGMVMTDAVEDALQRELARVAEDAPGGPHARRGRRSRRRH